MVVAGGYDVTSDGRLARVFGGPPAHQGSLRAAQVLQPRCSGPHEAVGPFARGVPRPPARRARFGALRFRCANGRRAAMSQASSLHAGSRLARRC